MWYSRRQGGRIDMRLAGIVLLCACVCLTVGDVAHIKTTKTKLIRSLARAKHHKRGVLTDLPPYKLGYDIPVVTHSVVKPVVVRYPPAAAVTAVKVPLANPLTRYPVPVGHKVPVHHPHYGLKFPHGTKTVVVPKPEQHYHHHHHHLAPKPVIPIVPAPVPVPATPVVPIGAPATVHAHPVPAPAPPVFLQPAPIPAPAPAPVFPAPAFASNINLLPHGHLHLKPAVPAAPIQPAPFPQLLPYASHFPYVLRPGNSVQTSFFATYPRYPLLNYQSPLVPLPPVAPAGQVLFERPQVHPHFHLLQQAAGQEGVVFEQSGPVPVEPTFLQSPAGVPHHHTHLQPTQPTLHLQPQPDVHVHHDVHLQPAHPEVHLHQDGQLQPIQPDIHLHTAQPGLVPTQPTIHVQPTQPGIHQIPLEHDGWSPVPAQPHDFAPSQPTPHFGQGQEGHFGQDGHHQFTQEQGTQVYEHHSGNDQYHDYQNQLQHHIQQQLEQAQYEQHLHNQQHHIAQEYGVPNQNVGQQDFSQQGQSFGQQDFSQQGQGFGQQDLNQQGQSFGQQDFSQQGQGFGQQDFSQNGQGFGQQDFSQNGQNFGQGFNQQDYSQQGHDFSQQQPAAEYGVPQGAEGRSAEGEEDPPLYHNHIPLMLQPPLERPLEHFR